MNFLLRTCFDIIADQEFRYFGASKLRVATHRHSYMTMDMCICAHMRRCKIAPLLLCVGAVAHNYTCVSVLACNCVGASASICACVCLYTSSNLCIKFIE